MVADDEGRSRERLVDLLRSDRHDVCAVADGKEALAVAETFRPELLILDGRLPGLDSRELARRLREASDLGIIFVNGSGTTEDLRSSYEAGADNYFTKPFDFDHLLAAARALLRRLGGSPAVTRVGGLVVDEGRARVTVDGVALELTPIELNLLVLLVANRGRVVSKGELMVKVWGYSYDQHLVEVHLNRLRTKLGPAVIRTVRGQGYLVG